MLSVEHDTVLIIVNVGRILEAPFASLDLDREADAVEAAVQKVLEMGLRTVDIMSEGMTQLSCSEMGSAIAGQI